MDFYENTEVTESLFGKFANNNSNIQFLSNSLFTDKKLCLCHKLFNPYINPSFSRFGKLTHGSLIPDPRSLMHDQTVPGNR